MNNLTITEILSFFSSLDLKKKIEVLSELTNALNRSIQEQVLVEENSDIENSAENDLIDELFGIWKEEEQLSEESIINRTISDREINLN